MTAQCKQCNQPNRDIAKYCKFCGAEIISLNGKVRDIDLDELIGLSELKSAILEIITSSKRLLETGRQLDKKKFHTILIGNTGTAKSTIPDLLAKIYFNNGIITKPDCKKVNAVDFGSFAKDLTSNLSAAKGGIVFIDEVHHLIHEQTTLIAKLIVEMGKMNGDPIIILSSRPEGFIEYLEKNPEAKNKFKLIFKLEDLSANEMFEIALRQFQREKFSLNVEAETKLRKLFKSIMKKKDKEFSNGITAIDIAKKIIHDHSLILDNLETFDTITENSIKAVIEEDRTIDYILQELNGFTGMLKVKDFIHALIDNLQQEKEKQALGLKIGDKVNLHTVITGNPGTGKTMVTRTLGQILSSIGFLDRGHTVEVNSKDLVAGYVGQTKILTDAKIVESFGGILFIDEAHQLASGNSFEDEAIKALLPRLENDRDKFVCVIAGYPKEIEKFLDSDPGLRRRFTNRIHIEDYTPQELFEMFQKKCEKENYFLMDDAKDKALIQLKEKHDKRDIYFGNAGEVRNIFEQIKLNIGKRIKNIHDKTKDDYLKILAEDIPGTEPSQTTLTQDEAIKVLNEMIGLSAVKKEITDLINLLAFQKRRQSHGGQQIVISEHFIFKGSPGTGKTTVARILANIFKSMGILPKGQLIEVSSEGLIEGYVRQTGEKTNKVIDSAIGGVLFIDEAYGLVDGGPNDFGKEAITALLQRLENDRGKFITIAAGYDKDMDRFLQSNPGLPSRFTKTIHFDDYTPDEMVNIFKKIVTDKSMQLEENMDVFLLDYFSEIYLTKDDSFANARTVRTVFEKFVLKNQARRLAKLEKNGIEIDPLLNILTKEDFK